MYVSLIYLAWLVHDPGKVMICVNNVHVAHDGHGAAFQGALHFDRLLNVNNIHGVILSGG